MKYQEGLLCKLPSIKNVIYISIKYRKRGRKKESETERAGVNVIMTPVL